MPPLDLYDVGFVGVAGASGANDWTETFNFESDSGWSLVAGSNGTIDVDPPAEANKLDYDLVEDLCSSTARKMFAEGELSDTFWTMLANEVIWTLVDTVPAPLFYGASDNDLPMKDANSKDFLGGLMAGCGTVNKGDHGCTKDGTAGTSYSLCWTGNGSGSDNWDTLFRTSSTTARYIVYPDSNRSGTASYDETFDVLSTTMGLDRILACGANDGAGGRRSAGTIDEIIFKNEVNEE